MYYLQDTVGRHIRGHECVLLSAEDSTLLNCTSTVSSIRWFYFLSIDLQYCLGCYKLGLVINGGIEEKIAICVGFRGYRMLLNFETWVIEKKGSEDDALL